MSTGILNAAQVELTQLPSLPTNALRLGDLPSFFPRVYDAITQGDSVDNIELTDFPALVWGHYTYEIRTFASPYSVSMLLPILAPVGSILDMLFLPDSGADLTLNVYHKEVNVAPTLVSATMDSTDPRLIRFVKKPEAGEWRFAHILS